MTDLEWETIEALLENGWPGDFTEAQGDAYRVFLATHSAEALLEALQTLAQTGSTFRPSASEIVQAVNRDPGCPTFDEAYQLLFGRRGAVLAGSHHAAIAAGDEAHPMVGAFIRAQGYDRLRLLPLDDPDWGGAERRRLEEAWDRHLEACERRLATGRALESMGRREQIGPRKLDPLALLPELRPVVELEPGDVIEDGPGEPG